MTGTTANSGEGFKGLTWKLNLKHWATFYLMLHCIIKCKSIFIVFPLLFIVIDFIITYDIDFKLEFYFIYIYYVYYAMSVFMSMWRGTTDKC